MNIRIISRPDGEAPEEIRDKWIGLTLPVIEDSNPGEETLVVGVLSNQLKVVEGYSVYWDDAMLALDEESRHWWTRNISYPITSLTFDQNCCEVVT